MSNFFLRRAAFFFALFLSLSCIGFSQAQAPSTYAAYTGTDAKTIPPAPALGPANSILTDPTFGSSILRVTDPNTNGGESFVPTDSGFHRSWNANSTAIKLTGPHGDGWWIEFNPSTFKVGDGSSHPVPHSVPFGATWEWSAVDPNVIYYLNGNNIAKYNISTGTSTNIGGPSDGEAVDYMAVVIGQDNWVCSAAGSGQQDTYTKLFCINPTSPGTSKFIDIYNKTVNGVAQGDPNWPTSASGQVIGVHDISGGTGANWLEVTTHQDSWGANGGAVFDLATNTWTEITAADIYWGGHVSMGNGTYANSSGSQDGRDSRGIILRDPDNAMNSAEYRFVGQPAVTNNKWCDADHISWLNSMTNPNAPILVSRYYANAPNCAFELTGEIYAAAVDGSGTIYRFAHNHDGGCYYSEGFAQISNDGNWALFSSYWDATLGPDTSFGCQTRIDTFIVALTPGSGSSGGTATASGGTSSSSGGGTSSTSSGSSGSSSSTGTGATTSSGTGTADPPSTGTTAPVTTSSGTAAGDTGTTVVPTSTVGSSVTSSGTSSTMQVGYGWVSGNPNAPAGLAIFGYRPNGVLVSEAGVPATGMTQQGRIFAEVAGVVNTGFAVANPNNKPANISFYFTDTSGNQIASGTTQIPVLGQTAKFLSEAPYSVPQSTTGTFTFTSDIPVSAIALRGYTNERGEFLITTLPIANPAAPASGTLYFPHFVSGGGWATEFDLVNPTDSPISGSLNFFQQGTPGSQTPAMSLAINGQATTSVPYSIPARSSVQFVTTGQNSNVNVGSAQVVPAPGSAAPGGNAVFSLTQNGVHVTEAGVPLQTQGSAFRMYIESSPSVQSGIAVLNNSGSDETVSFDVTALDGSSTGLQGSVVVPAGGQRALFMNQIPGLTSLPQTFKGVVRVSTPDNAGIVVFGLRGRWNERNEFLVTTTTPTNEADTPTGTIVFPDIVDGGGYTTQFIQYSGTPAEPGSGSMQMYTQSGSPMSLSLQ